MSEQGYSAGPNRRCERCGSAVTPRFVRVFGTKDGVYGCLDCLTRQELSVGEAAIRPDEDAAGVHARWVPDEQPPDR
ncbi:DUF7563 family protein [Halorubrum trueperi]|uniref:Small CPxCG-related zinc finger protein n=1 Tax=Halorubrum trueperi TaxID=2004704 RepID=A0ABD5UNY8_9EURY